MDFGRKQFLVVLASDNPLKAHQPHNFPQQCCLYTVALFLLLSSCRSSTELTPYWIPPGGNLQNTRYFPSVSPIKFKEMNIELLWDSKYIPQRRIDYIIVRPPILATGAAHGRTFLGAFGSQALLFCNDGELIFDHPGLSWGILSDIEGHGQSSVIETRPDGIFIYDIKGKLKSSLRAEKDIEQVKAADIDGDNIAELVVSEREREPVPSGSAQVIWDKRTIRAYNALTLEQKWEYRTGPLAYPDAIADINCDGHIEIVCGTYSYENAFFWKDMVDTNHAYVFALDNLGKRLWMQTFMAQFASTTAAIEDLNNDEQTEVVVSCASWLKNWGGVFVLDSRNGTILHQFPPKGSLDYSIAGIGIADIDRDGHKEIVCSSVGKSGSFFVLKNNCNATSLEYRISPNTMDYTYIHCRIEAIADLDGDAKPEIIGFAYVEKVISNDFRFMYSKFTEPQLLILDSNLSLKARLFLEEVPTAVIVSDIKRGGGMELIVLTDRISVYQITEGRR